MDNRIQGKLSEEQSQRIDKRDYFSFINTGILEMVSEMDGRKDYLVFASQTCKSLKSKDSLVQIFSSLKDLLSDGISDSFSLESDLFDLFFSLLIRFFMFENLLSAIRKKIKEPHSVGTFLRKNSTSAHPKLRKSELNIFSNQNPGKDDLVSSDSHSTVCLDPPKTLFSSLFSSVGRTLGAKFLGECGEKISLLRFIKRFLLGKNPLTEKPFLSFDDPLKLGGVVAAVLFKLFRNSLVKDVCGFEADALTIYVNVFKRYKYSIIGKNEKDEKNSWNDIFGSYLKGISLYYLKSLYSTQDSFLKELNIVD